MSKSSFSPDRVSPEVRSRMMAQIGSTNTRPELLIRINLHALGWRYRLHTRDLPGKPDLVFQAKKAVIFVQGCFWHGHDCARFSWPSTRSEFWRAKISGNVVRDRRVRQQLAGMGWRTLDVWECTLRGKNRLALEEVIGRCVEFLQGEELQSVIGTPETVLPEGYSASPICLETQPFRFNYTNP